MEDGKQMRSRILAKRDSMTAADRSTKSSAICATLMTLDEIQDSSTIFLYVSFRSEVQTIELLNTLIQNGKKVCVPITYVKEKRLDAIHITDPDKQFVPGYCNIPEPAPEILTTNLVPPESIDTVILPGSVFDRRCGRFGYGGGFYDRFVSAIPKAHRIALAYDLQIVERAPLQPHDEILDLVITETRVIRGKRK
ncbi:5-formyltetrahydrofolate cyclo-ligase [Desulfopila sp. IMCC35008]|uniref:5-formyltetrahydrofolate cyclo-ligase n=1 Tax=Desulfopila sp. IMCC35008 TaxID=2653858 RepID=UPI0013D4427A|nr:5-formyltetrahydrofolate cyclo-ligase [Desulfopila sp. IMCC35008]